MVGLAWVDEEKLKDKFKLQEFNIEDFEGYFTVNLEETNKQDYLKTKISQLVLEREIQRDNLHIENTKRHTVVTNLSK